MSPRYYSTYDRAPYFRLHAKISAYIAAKLEPTPAIMSEVLGFPVSPSHLQLCASIVSSSVVVNLPTPFSPHLSAFVNIAGPEIARIANKLKPGCYRIFGPNTDSSYIGQSIHLGGRVKGHAKGHNAGTKDFVNGLGTTGLVQLFLVPTNANLEGLTLSQFLCVLEQYLFITFRPTVNKSLVATPGYAVSEESILEQRLAKGHPVFVYLINKVDGTLSLLFKFESSSMVGGALGFNRL